MDREWEALPYQVRLRFHLTNSTQALPNRTWLLLKSSWTMTLMKSLVSWRVPAVIHLGHKITVESTYIMYIYICFIYIYKLRIYKENNHSLANSTMISNDINPSTWWPTISWLLVTRCWRRAPWESWARSEPYKLICCSKRVEHIHPGIG